MDAKHLSDRAKHRLRLAADLLRSDGVRLDCPRDQFYPKIQEALAAMASDQQARLRALVDWVEEYDNAGPPENPALAKQPLRPTRPAKTAP